MASSSTSFIVESTKELKLEPIDLAELRHPHHVESTKELKLGGPSDTPVQYIGRIYKRIET